MQRTMCKSKIHRATVTDANLNYVGSITIDEDLMDAADLLPYEQVQIVNNNNGARFETYIIKGKRGTGTICLNGAAARLVQPGDIIIIISYVQVTESEARNFKPRILVVNEKNQIIAIKDSEGDSGSQTD
ncbi:MAG: aspartate 1-decarboxylase [Clostridium sp.]|nr:aspartate 1-decarboxylase [Clostridium sp.]